MANSLKILLGADPELFLTNDKGQLISAHDILPGTKVMPFEVPHGAIQVDGVAAEFNIAPAADSKTFISNIRHVMAQLETYCKGNKLTITPYAVFDKDYFNSLPELVKELGCNPDFNAWTGQVNPAPDGAEGSMRTASGHIHIGWCEGVNPHGKTHFKDCCSLIQQLDYYVGLYSLMWDRDNTRRKMYGQAGAFRPKPYGAEYRVMSNVWLKSPLIQAWIWNAVNQAVNHLMNRKQSMKDIFGDYAQQVINGNDYNWYKSPTGQKIINEMGIGSPDLREIFPEKSKVVVVDDKEELYRKLTGKKSKFFVDMTLSSTPIDEF